MNLTKKYLALSFALLMLLVAAVNVAAAERKLVVVGEEYAPFEFVRDGQVVGIDIDIARHIFQKMNVPVEFSIQPWKRAWYSVEQGTVDAVLSTSRKSSREPYLIYPTEDMWVSEYVFFVKNDKKKPVFAGYETAVRENLTVGITSGNSYDADFWQAFPYKDGSTTFQGDLSSAVLNAQLDAAKDIPSNLKKLAMDRIDLCVIDKIVGSYNAGLLGFGKQIANYDNVLFSKGYPMPFVKKSSYPDIEEIAARFEKELKAMKENGEYQRIVDKWLTM